jgi:hypothetical protein
MGIDMEHNTNNTCRHGDKCVRIWNSREMCMHPWIHIRRNQNNKHGGRKGGQTYAQGYAYNKITVPEIRIEFVEKEERKQRGGYEYKIEHKQRSARNTGTKTGRDENIHK